MELCSLDDAFPQVQGPNVPFVGGTDGRPTKEERRAAKKRAKQCKEQAKKAETDPDRPAVLRMDSVEAFEGSQQLASIDEMPGGIYKKPVGQRPLAQLPPATAPPAEGELPSYFGRGEDEPTEESFANYSGIQGDDSTYRLVPDFTKVFDFKGLEKAAGGGVKGRLPEPNLEDAWKPSAPGATYTAYVATAPEKGRAVTHVDATPDWAMEQNPGEGPTWGIWAPQAAFSTEEAVDAPAKAPSPPAAPERQPNDPPVRTTPETTSALTAQMDAIQMRLRALEGSKQQDTQSELLLFVGTGLFVLFTFHLASRC